MLTLHCADLLCCDTVVQYFVEQDGPYVCSVSAQQIESLESVGFCMQWCTDDGQNIVEIDIEKARLKNVNLVALRRGVVQFVNGIYQPLGERKAGIPRIFLGVDDAEIREEVRNRIISQTVDFRCEYYENDILRVFLSKAVSCVIVKVSDSLLVELDKLENVCGLAFKGNPHLANKLAHLRK